MMAEACQPHRKIWLPMVCPCQFSLLTCHCTQRNPSMKRSLLLCMASK